MPTSSEPRGARVVPDTFGLFKVIDADGEALMTGFSSEVVAASWARMHA